MEHFAQLAQSIWNFVQRSRVFWKVEMAIENHECFGILEDEYAKKMQIIS